METFCGDHITYRSTGHQRWPFSKDELNSCIKKQNEGSRPLLDPSLDSVGGPCASRQDAGS